MPRKIRTFGEWMKSWREARGWSLRELEEKLGGHPNKSMLSFYETGRHPAPTSIDDLRRIAGALDVPIGEAFAYAGAPAAAMSLQERRELLIELHRLTEVERAIEEGHQTRTGGAGPRRDPRRTKHGRHVAMLREFSGCSATVRRPRRDGDRLAPVIPLRSSA